ncbi:MAG TPA: zinc-ribbon domain-containing protein, partial [Polyangiaceae bacterium]
MKFLCDQCKAKYQIADEKVAGKTVRMKCRKCGHMIEVKSEITETSVAGARPPDDATKVGAAPADPVSMMNVTTTPARPAGAPRPGAPAAPRAPASKLATSLGNQRPGTASKPPAATRPDSALAGAFQKSVKEEARVPIATNTEWYVAINGVPVGPIRLTELRR